MPSDAYRLKKSRLQARKSARTGDFKEFTELVSVLQAKIHGRPIDERRDFEKTILDRLEYPSLFEMVRCRTPVLLMQINTPSEAIEFIAKVRELVGHFDAKSPALELYCLAKAKRFVDEAYEGESQFQSRKRCADSARVWLDLYLKL